MAGQQHQLETVRDFVNAIFDCDACHKLIPRNYVRFANLFRRSLNPKQAMLEPLDNAKLTPRSVCSLCARYACATKAAGLCDAEPDGANWALHRSVVRERMAAHVKGDVAK
jgi:hypothetical protein